MKFRYSYKRIRTILLLALAAVIFSVTTFLLVDIANIVRDSERKRISNDMENYLNVEASQTKEFFEGLHGQVSILSNAISFYEGEDLFTEEAVTGEDLFGVEQTLTGVKESPFVENVFKGGLDLKYLEFTTLVNVDGWFNLDEYSKLSNNKSVVSNLYDLPCFQKALNGEYAVCICNVATIDFGFMAVYSPIYATKASKSASEVSAVLLTAYNLEAVFTEIFTYKTGDEFAHIVLSDTYTRLNAFSSAFGYTAEEIENYLKTEFDFTNNYGRLNAKNSYEVYLKAQTINIEGYDKPIILVGLYEQDFATQFSADFLVEIQNITILTIAILLSFALLAGIILHKMRKTHKIDESKFITTIEKFNKGLFEYDIRTNRLIFTETTQKMLDCKNTEYFIDHFLRECDVPQKDAENARSKIVALGRTGECVFNLYCNRIKKYLQFSMYAIPIKANEKERPVMGIIEDITTNLATIEKLEERAKIDVLTDLLNRETIFSIVEKCISTHPNRTCAFLLLDIDDFKQVNDSYGHYVGDMLLKRFGKMLSGFCKEKNYFAARLSGDEFCVFVSHVDSLKKLYEFAHHICVSASAMPVAENIERYVSVSIGIALFPVHADSLEKLRSCADNALYKAKLKYGSCYSVFDNLESQGPRDVFSDAFASSEEEEFSKLVTSGDEGYKQIKDILTKALDNKELELYYQPKVSVKTNSVKCEALTRWISPTYGVVMPSKFIPLFEHSKMTFEFDIYVLKQAMQFITENLVNGEYINVSVNQSLSTILSPFYLRELSDLLKTYKIPPTVLTIEITETTVFTSLRTITKVITGMRAMGFAVSIDDFGSGYTTLNIVRDLDISELKLDKSFLVRQEDKATTIISSLCQMSSKIGITTVAEGVETEEQVVFLAECGCDYLQGYFFDRAVSGEEFIKNLVSDKYNILKKKVFAKKQALQSTDE